LPAVVFPGKLSNSFANEMNRPALRLRDVSFAIIMREFVTDAARHVAPLPEIQSRSPAFLADDRSRNVRNERATPFPAIGTIQGHFRIGFFTTT
jgi:hypothetical protein